MNIKTRTPFPSILSILHHSPAWEKIAKCHCYRQMDVFRAFLPVLFAPPTPPYVTLGIRRFNLFPKSVSSSVFLSFRSPVYACLYLPIFPRVWRQRGTVRKQASAILPQSRGKATILRVPAEHAGHPVYHGREVWNLNRLKAKNNLPTLCQYTQYFSFFKHNKGFIM